MVVHLIK